MYYISNLINGTRITVIIKTTLCKSFIPHVSQHSKYLYLFQIKLPALRTVLSSIMLTFVYFLYVIIYGRNLLGTVREEIGKCQQDF